MGSGITGALYMRQMQKQHQDKGWNDIAYNFILDPRERICYEGRGALVIPGAQKGYNTGTIAIAVMGNYQTQNANWRVIEDLVHLMQHVFARAWGPEYIDGGHRDAPNQDTTCPGDGLRNRIGEINTLIHLGTTGETMQYKNVTDCPTETDPITGKKIIPSWVMTVIDDRRAAGVIRPELTYSWTRALNDGRYWTMEYRAKQSE